MQWLEAHDPELANAVTGTCLERALHCTASSPRGVTFLYPSDKIRKEIIDDSNNNPEAAQEKLQSLIIHACIESLSDFDGSYNRLNFYLRQESLSSKKTKLTNGTEIGPLPSKMEFNPVENMLGHIKVWRLENDVLPPSSGEDKYVRPSKKVVKPKKIITSKSTKGSGPQGPPSEFCKKYSNVLLHHNAFEAAVSLLEYLQNCHEKAYEVVCANGLVSKSDPVATLAWIICPYKQDRKGSEELDVAILKWNCYHAYKGRAVDCYMKHCDNLKGDSDAALQKWLSASEFFARMKATQEANSFDKEMDEESVKDLRITVSNAVFSGAFPCNDIKSEYKSFTSPRITKIDASIQGKSDLAAAYADAQEGDQLSVTLRITTAESKLSRTAMFDQRELDICEFVNFVEKVKNA